MQYSAVILSDEIDRTKTKNYLGITERPIALSEYLKVDDLPFLGPPLTVLQQRRLEVNTKKTHHAVELLIGRKVARDRQFVVRTKPVLDLEKAGVDIQYMGYFRVKFEQRDIGTDDLEGTYAC
jgi:hypothetical protein